MLAFSDCHNDRAGNEAALDVVQRSILILCLDEVVASMDPWDVQQALHVLVGGPNGENAGNRWYDKTVQVRHVAV